MRAALIGLIIAAFTSCGGGDDNAPVNAPPAAPPASPPPMPAPAEPANADIPAGGDHAISQTPTKNFTVLEGSNNGSIVGRAAEVDIEHPSADKGIQVEVLNPTGDFWSGQIQLPFTAPVAQDDVLLLYVEFKLIETTDETGAGYITAFVEGLAPEYTKYLQFRLDSTGEWQSFFLPFKMGGSFNANQNFLKFGFGAGSRPQTVQLTNIQLFNYKNSKTLSELPQTRPSYAGREPDAAWRAEAEARIEQYRKGNLVVKVVNPNGEPISGAQVSIDLQKHAYHFGSVAAASRLINTDADSLIYREKLLENFNQSSLENNLKWQPWVGDWGEAFTQNNAINALQYLKDQDLFTRGHVMVWPSKRNMPEFVQAYMPENAPQNADATVLSEVIKHIQDISEKTQGLVDEWDVLNEPFDNNYLMRAFGDEVMLDWFAEAEKHNPNVGLYLNDYSIISGGGTNTPHQQHFIDTLAYLTANQAPINGMGVQSHFSSTPTPITDIYTILERLHSAYPDLAIRSTEFDIDTTDEAMQADYTRDFLTIFFSHPATVGIQKWGFWAGAHWRPNAAMYDLDWHAKPNQQAWHSLIYDTWWSKFEDTSNASGELAVRGFYGEYTITIRAGNNVVHESNFKLSKDSVDTYVITLNQ